MIRKFYSIILLSILLMCSCTSKKEAISNTATAEILENGFFAMCTYYDNGNLRLENGSAEKYIKEKGITITPKTINHNGNTIVNMEQLNSEFSYLVDYFKDKKGSYVIISEVNTTYMKSSSDSNTLPRNKLYICDLSTQKKYTYTYTSAKNNLILPIEYYKALLSGITIKSIDSASKLITFEIRKNHSFTTVEVPMVEVAEFYAH